MVLLVFVVKMVTVLLMSGHRVDAEQVEPFEVAKDVRDNFIPQLLA